MTRVDGEGKCMDASVVDCCLVGGVGWGPSNAAGRPMLSNTIPSFRRAPLEPTSTDLTTLLRQASEGSRDAQNLLFQLLVPRLREMAAAQMSGEKPGHTLSPTGLVNEAFLRLASQETLPDKNVAQFLAIMATTMRRVLVDRWK